MLELASGTINVLEKKVFDKLDQERMLKAPDKEAAFAVLFDTDLGELASKEKDIDKILQQDINNLKAGLARLLEEDKLLFYFLFLRFDSLNLKLALKKILSEKELGTAFGCSIEPCQKIEQAVSGLLNKKDKGSADGLAFNYFVKEMVENSVKELSAGPVSSEEIERVVDKNYFLIKLKIAVSPFLKEIVCLEIDLANIRALLRAHKQTSFIEGGNFKSGDLVKLINEKEGEIMQSLKRFSEIFQLSLVIDKFNKDKSEIGLERGLANFLSGRILEKAKQTGEGVEKALAYFQKKVNAASNIRLIMFAKANNLALSEIERQLLAV